MTPTQIRAVVVAEKTAWIHRMLDGLEDLPTDTKDIFEADGRNPAAAESYLRRSLEALLDLGRHVLAKGFGLGIPEYKHVATELGQQNILQPSSVELLVEMAGYRNRLVHFYNEISHDELYEICTERLDDIERVLNEILEWLRANPEKVDGEL